MTKGLSRGVVSCLVAFLGLECMAWAQKGPKEVFAFPPLNKIDLPEIHEVTLTNQMKVFLVEDRDFPTVDYKLMVRTGTLHDPADKVGLAAMTASVLRTSGSENMPGDLMDKKLEMIGGSLTCDANEYTVKVDMSLLREHAELGLDLMANMLMHPAFDQNKIDLAKVQQRTAIARRNDEIYTLAIREFQKIIYGSQSPYARHPEYATVSAITRRDILDFFHRYFQPNNTQITVRGDFDWKEMVALLEKELAGWTARPVHVPPDPKVNYRYDFSVSYVEKLDAVQSIILIGHIGGLMNDPDYPVMQVLSPILSYERMFKKLSSEEGLYWAGGDYEFGYMHPGRFFVGATVKSESTVKVVRKMLDELKRITEQGVSDEELDLVRKFTLNGFVFEFDSKEQLVDRLALYKYFNFPKDFLETVMKKVEKVTKADVLRVARTHLHPDTVHILVVGNQAKFDAPLSVLGPVKTIDITIPQGEPAERNTK